jgi:hypothetical protein
MYLPYILGRGAFTKTNLRFAAFYRIYEQKIQPIIIGLKKDELGKLKR